MATSVSPALQQQWKAVRPSAYDAGTPGTISCGGAAQERLQMYARARSHVATLDSSAILQQNSHNVALAKNRRPAKSTRSKFVCGLRVRARAQCPFNVGRTPVADSVE